MDGNFSAKHRPMKHPEQDVAFADGHGYMVTDGPYREHLATAIEYKEVRDSLCCPRMSTDAITRKPPVTIIAPFLRPQVSTDGTKLRELERRHAPGMVSFCHMLALTFNAVKRK